MDHCSSGLVDFDPGSGIYLGYQGCKYSWSGFDSDICWIRDQRKIRLERYGSQPGN